MKKIGTIAIVVACLALTSCGSYNAAGCGLTSDANTTPQTIEVQKVVSTENV
ncbi:MAG: hypothetical protein JKY08_00890 [Flavobacteriaceae bacterium]|nr:hypothetical protein [Flavobacteriaceae bacterium]